MAYNSMTEFLGLSPLHSRKSFRSSISSIKKAIEIKYPSINTNEWIDLLPSERLKVKISVSYDMGWNKRASGWQYNSLNGVIV